MEIKRFIGGILEANCYVVSQRRGGDSDAKAGCFVIDPGYYPARVEKYIKENAFAPEGIILTHHHSDHSGAAERLKKELDCPIMIHREDADRFRGEADRLLEDGDVLTMTITQESPRQMRIYMLRLVGRHAYSSAKVIIIVKMRE